MRSSARASNNASSLAILRPGTLSSIPQQRKPHRPATFVLSRTRMKLTHPAPAVAADPPRPPSPPSPTPPEPIQPSTHSPLTDHSYTTFSVNAALSSRNHKPLLEECIPKAFAKVRYNSYELQWHHPINVELTAMRDNHVSEIMARTPAIRPMNSKWVFSIKYGNNGDSFTKARLVAWSFRDKHPYHIYEINSPVINQWLIHWALTIANCPDFDIIKFDVSTAFLNGNFRNQPTYQYRMAWRRLPISFYAYIAPSMDWKPVVRIGTTLLMILSPNWDLPDHGRIAASTTNVALIKKIELLVYVDNMLLLTDDPSITQRLRHCKTGTKLNANQIPIFLLALKFGAKGPNEKYFCLNQSTSRVFSSVSTSTKATHNRRPWKPASDWLDQKMPVMTGNTGLWLAHSSTSPAGPTPISHTRWMPSVVCRTPRALLKKITSGAYSTI